MSHANDCFRRALMLACLSLFAMSTPVSHAESILFSGREFAAPDSMHSLLVQIADNDDPIVGYSLNIDVIASPGAVGGVRPIAARSNFFPDQNIILRGGGTLDPDLSVIIETLDGGLFINAQEQALRPVPLAVTGTSDILAEIAFNILPQTEGTFTIVLGPFSALLGEHQELVPFAPRSFELRIPEPATAGLLALGAFVVFQRLHRPGR